MSIILDIFFPRRCLNCGKFGRYFCRRCRSRIPHLDRQFCPVCLGPSIIGRTHLICLKDNSLDGLYIHTYYRGVIKKALKTLKYRLVSDIASEISDIFYSNYPQYLPEFNFLIPVPLHIKRFRERGFNQSEILAGKLSKLLKISLETDNLVRVRPTRPQFSLEKQNRKSNVLNVFAVRNHEIIKGKKIAVIDDVATTVSTLRECAKVLKKNGAENVWGLAIAHG